METHLRRGQAEPPTLSVLSEREFGALVEPHRRELRAHGYRMLGSLEDAEEVVQEAFLRAWRGRETFAGRASFRTWLYKITTNLCLDLQKQRARRTLPRARQAAASLEDPMPPALREPIWLEPYPDDLPAPEEAGPEARYAARESVTLAFMTALHLLPPRQRAVLLLRDVLGWQAGEAADLLETSVPAVKSALHRARATLGKHYPGEAPPPAALDEAQRNLLQRYVRAWEAADVEGFTRLLREEATFSMPPLPVWYRGRENVGGLAARTVFGGQAQGRWRLRPTRANSRPAFGLYRRDDETGEYGFYGIQVVTLDDAGIGDVTTFIHAGLARFFGMPARLEGGQSGAETGL